MLSYRIDRNAVYPNLAGLFRGGIDADLIPEQWDQLVRVAASLKNRVCPAQRGCPAIGQQLSFGSPGESVDHAWASREDHIHPEIFE